MVRRRNPVDSLGATVLLAYGCGASVTTAPDATVSATVADATTSQPDATRDEAALAPFDTAVSLPIDAMPDATDATANETGASPDAGTDAYTDAATPIDPARLYGAWRFPCDRSRPWAGLTDDAAGHDQTTVTLAPATAAVDVTRWNATGCSGDVAFHFRVEYSTVFTDPPTPVADAREIDLHIARSVVEIDAPSWIETANRVRLCGFADWQLAVQRDVTGSGCELGVDPWYLYAAGTARFDIGGLRDGRMCFAASGQQGSRAGLSSDTTTGDGCGDRVN